MFVYRDLRVKLEQGKPAERSNESRSNVGLEAETNQCTVSSVLVYIILDTTQVLLKVS